MNCQEFWNEMPESATQGGVLGMEWSEHLEKCPGCAGLLDSQRAVAAGLRAAAAEWRHVDAPPRVEARLMAAFRRQAGVAAQPPARPWWAPAATWALTAATAALALFLVQVRQPSAGGATARATVSAPASASGAAWADENGDFIALPHVEQLGANEDFDLVRVEVPRSSMIALGFVVSADRASEPVEADVVLGSDGLARAVRFVD